MTAIKQIEDALKAGPTDGPWIAAGPSSGAALPVYLHLVVADREGDDDDTYCVCRCPIGLDDDPESGVTMDYIAVCNPANMREVLAHITAQDAENAQLREQNTELDAACAAQDAEIARLRDMVWTLTEHNALHFGESHNTVIQGRATLATTTSKG